jgi:hypothetical protein
MTNFNRVRFFNDPLRIPFHLFIDVCKKGIGGFYYKYSFLKWESNTAKIVIYNLFSIPIINID